MRGLLFIALPLAMLVASAIAVAMVAVLQYRLGAKVSPQRRVALVLVLVGIGALLTVALTTRNLNETPLGGAGGAVLYEDLEGGFTASRWLSLFLVGAALVEILRGCLRSRQATKVDPAWPLLVALLLFYGGTLLIQAMFSEHVGFSYKELYVPILLWAVYYQRPDDVGEVIAAAKGVILALTLSSLLAIAVRPDFVLHRPEPGALPGIDWRLFGLTPHANTLGPIALLGLLLELHSPSPRRWLRLLNLATAGAVFLLAQSRTAWSAGLVIALAVLVPLWVMPRQWFVSDPRSFSRAVWTLVLCIGVLITVACGLVVFGGTEYLQRKTELGTLNGRFQIWDITLQAWRENVLFGYGPEVWGAERRWRFNMFHVGQAHNQFVQTLGEAGLAGLMLLVMYLLTLLIAATRRFAVSRGIVLAMLLLLLARCVTEAPMRSEGLLSWPTFLHALLLALACHHWRQPLPAPIHSASRRTDRRGAGRMRFSVGLPGASS